MRNPGDRAPSVSFVSFVVQGFGSPIACDVGDHDDFMETATGGT